mmetsp:Transcript_35029/g.81286  ORF Transcript_35029/g.81286 Transcript_35029/m.81286 type:complete len:578 (+) Transcript_35029:107-1840(+)
MPKPGAMESHVIPCCLLSAPIAGRAPAPNNDKAEDNSKAEMTSAWRNSQTLQSWLHEWEERQRLQLQEHQRATAKLVEGLREDILKRLGEHLSQDRHSHSQHSPSRSRILERSDTPHVTQGKLTNVPQHSSSRSERSLKGMNSDLMRAVGGKVRVPSRVSSGTTRFAVGATPARPGDCEPTSRPQSLLLKLVNSAWFKTITGFLIVAYAIVIGVQSDNEMRAALAGRNGEGWSKWTDVGFTVAFALEVLLRLMAEQLWYFNGPGWAWNVFDAFLVCTSVTEILNIFELNLVLLRIVSAVRTVRLLRVIRIFRFFTPLRLMASAFLSCLVSLCWAMVLLGTVSYIFAVGLLQAASQHLRHAEQLETVVETQLAVDFGNIWKTMYSLALAMSNGRNWGEYSVPFMVISPWYGIAFVLFAIFVGLGVLNLLTGVFVESMHSLANVDREMVIQEEMARHGSAINQVRRLFDEADEHRSGVLTMKELKRHLNDSRLEAYFKLLRMDVSEAEGVFQLLDREDTGEVGIDEFVITCMRLKGSTARSIDMATALYENKRLHTMVRNHMARTEGALSNIQTALCTW